MISSNSHSLLLPEHYLTAGLCFCHASSDALQGPGVCLCCKLRAQVLLALHYCVLPCRVPQAPWEGTSLSEASTQAICCLLSHCTQQPWVSNPFLQERHLVLPCGMQKECCLTSQCSLAISQRWLLHAFVGPS